MYCKRCGKFIDYQAEICNECAAAEQTVAAQVQPVQVVSAPAQEGSMKTGLGKAIACAILGTVSLIFLEFMLIPLETISSYGYDDYYISELAGMFVLILFSIGLAIPSLILSISSIKTFKDESNAKRIKPIPTLILGIYGLSNAAASILCCGLIFFVLFLAMFALV